MISLLLLPPTILIGGTLPLFCKQFVTNEHRILSSIGMLYGLNTFGAVIGTVTCGFLMIPYLGVNESIWLCGLLNVIIGAIILRLGIAESIPVKNRETIENVPGDSNAGHTLLKTRLIGMLFFFAGFVALGNEIIWTRYLTLIIHNTVYIYTLTLAVVLLGIFLGSFIVSFFNTDSYQKISVVFSLANIGIGLSVLTVLMLPFDFWKGVIDTQKPSTLLWVCTLVFLFPSLLSGIVFPLANRLVITHPHQAGVGVGKMAAINTLGGILGSLSIGFIILPLVGLYRSIVLSTGISIAIGIIAITLLNKTVHTALKALIIGLPLILWLTIPLITGTKLPADFLAEKAELIDFREGLHSFLAVEKGPKDEPVLTINRLWQGRKNKGHQIMSAHIPMLLHQNPKAVLSIGVGVGQTTSRFLYYDIKQLDCIDIENELFDLLKGHFDSEWMDDSRVRLIVEDGRNFIAHTSNRYDIISIEIGQIFRPNLSSFYTEDFYIAVRKKLRENGLVSQFVPLKFLGMHEFLSVIRTFLNVFPESILWYNRNELLLIGSKSMQPKLTGKRLALLHSDTAVRSDLQFYYWGGYKNYVNKPEVFTAGYLSNSSGLKKLVEDAQIYRDNKPLLEYQSAKNQSTDVTILKEKIALIKRYAAPVQTILEKDTGDTALSRIETIRTLNLDNIIASDNYDTYLVNNNAALIREAYRLNPYNMHVTFKMGLIAVKKGDVYNAEKYFRDVLAIEPDFIPAYKNLGIILTNRRRFAEAIDLLTEALRREPENAKIHNSLGIAYAEQGEMEKAVKSFSKAVTIKPDYHNARDNLERGLRELRKK